MRLYNLTQWKQIWSSIYPYCINHSLANSFLSATTLRRHTKESFVFVVERELNSGICEHNNSIEASRLLELQREF